MANTHVKIDGTAPVDRFSFSDYGHSISWRVCTKGTGRLTVSTHAESKYLSFTAEETLILDHGRGRAISKTAYVTLDTEDAAKLYAWLKSKFEPVAI